MWFLMIHCKLFDFWPNEVRMQFQVVVVSLMQLNMNEQSVCQNKFGFCVIIILVSFSSYEDNPDAEKEKTEEKNKEETKTEEKKEK